MHLLLEARGLRSWAGHGIRRAGYREKIMQKIIIGLLAALLLLEGWQLAEMAAMRAAIKAAGPDAAATGPYCP